jgi:hypothetical protein
MCKQEVAELVSTAGAALASKAGESAVAVPAAAAA